MAAVSTGRAPWLLLQDYCRLHLPFGTAQAALPYFLYSYVFPEAAGKVQVLMKILKHSC